MGWLYHFSRTLRDDRSGAQIKLEFGKSGIYDGNNYLMFIRVDDERCIVLDEVTGREFCEAAERLAIYLGYDKPTFDELTRRVGRRSSTSWPTMLAHQRSRPNETLAA